MMKNYVEGIYYVTYASERNDEDDVSYLYLHICDSRMVRAAIAYEAEYDIGDVIGKFVEIMGEMDENGVIIINSMNNLIDVSKIDIPGFYQYSKIPVSLIFDYLFCETNHFRDGIKEVCQSVVVEFFNYCDAEQNTPISASELNRRYECARQAFDDIWYWKDFIEKNDINDRDIVLAGAIMACFTNYFTQEEYPIMIAEFAASILSDAVKYFGKSFLTEEETNMLIDSINCFYSDSVSMIRNKLLAGKLF